MILLGLWAKQYPVTECDQIASGKGRAGRKKIGEGKEEMEPLPEFLEEKSHTTHHYRRTCPAYRAITAVFGLRGNYRKWCASSMIIIK